MHSKLKEEFAEPQMQQLLEILAEYKLEYAAHPTKFLEQRIAEIEAAIQPIGKGIKRDFDQF